MTQAGWPRRAMARPRHRHIREAGAGLRHRPGILLGQPADTGLAGAHRAGRWPAGPGRGGGAGGWRAGGGQPGDARRHRRRGAHSWPAVPGPGAGWPTRPRSTPSVGPGVRRRRPRRPAGQPGQQGAGHRAADRGDGGIRAIGGQRATWPASAAGCVGSGSAAAIGRCPPACRSPGGKASPRRNAPRPRLAAQGLNNGQIGGRLYISKHTVAFHLRQNIRKLQISSRVELTRIVVEQDQPH